MNTDKMKAVRQYQGKVTAEHYQRALDAKAEGRPVVYVSAMFPAEIVKAFEPHLVTVYPENHSTLLISKGQSQLVRKAEVEGCDRMGCAYELFGTGYILEGLGSLDADDILDSKGRPVTKLPEPDILLACDNHCRVICEWFRHVSDLGEGKTLKMIT